MSMSTALHSTRQTVPKLTISVWLLGFTQIIGYGTLYYGFATLAEHMAASLRWPVSWVFGAFSLALLAGAVIAPAVGRRYHALQDGIDRPVLDARPVLPEHLQSRAMFLVTWGFALSGFVLMAILAQMVPLLAAMGISVMVGAWFGPAHVLIRFLNMVFGTESNPIAVTIMV